MKQKRVVAIVVSLFFLVPSLAEVARADTMQSGHSSLPDLTELLSIDMNEPFGGGGLFPGAVGNNTTDNNIYTIHGTFDPLEGELPFPEELKYNESNGYSIIQFIERARTSWVSSLESLGAEFFGYLPMNAYVAFLSEEIEDDPPEYVRWIGMYHPAYKLPPSIVDTVLDPTNDSMDITVETFGNNSEVVSFIEEHNGTVLNSTDEYVFAELNETELKALAFLESVRWVEENLEETILNDVATGIIGAPTVWGFPYWLNGRTQTIGILDSGLDTGVDNPGVPDIHLDFDDRVTFQNYFGSSPDDVNGHGTHVTGSAAGDGTRSVGQTLKGVAPMADIYFQAAGDDEGTGIIHIGGLTYAQIFNDAYNNNVRVHSDSWGSPGGYNTNSQQIDNYLWNNRDMVVVFAAGNAGVDADSDGVVDMFSISSQAQAKNIIAVGATENDRNMLQVDSDIDGQVDEDLRGDMNGDDWPGIQGVDDDADTGLDFRDIEVREALEVVADVDTDWDANNVEDLLAFGWHDNANDGANNDWDFYCDVNLNGQLDWAVDEKFMDEDFSGTLTAGDMWIYDNDNLYQPQSLDCLPGAPLIALIDEDAWDNQGLLGRMEFYFVGFDHDEDGIVPWAELNTAQDLTRNYNDPQVFPVMTAIVNRIYGFLYQANDDDEDGLMNEDLIDTYGGHNPGSFPVDPLFSDPQGNNQPEGMAAFSSRGPANDGRIKPDLVAPGTWILSTKTSIARNPQEPWFRNNPYKALYNDYYAYSMGTSMATPFVSGSALLVREYYIEERGITPQMGVTPSSALIKATLVNGAYDIAGQYGESGPIPNGNEGWGRVDLPNSVLMPFHDPRQLLFVEETTGLQRLPPPNPIDMKMYILTLNEETYPLKITLSWTDPPGNPTAAIQLVNNLDLRVITPDDRVYLGNVFSEGESVPGGDADVLNNIENVFISNPIAGEYIIMVEGQNIDVNFSPQPFALVVTCGDAELDDPAPSFVPPDIYYFHINDDDTYTAYQQDNRLDFHTDQGDGSLEEMRFSETPNEMWVVDPDFVEVKSTDGSGWGTEFSHVWDPLGGGFYPANCDYYDVDCTWTLDYPGFHRLEPYYAHVQVGSGDSLKTEDEYAERQTYGSGTSLLNFWGEEYFGEYILYTIDSDDTTEDYGMHVTKLKGYFGYPRDSYEWWKIETDEAASSMRLHFNELDVYDGDVIQIRDWLGRLVESITDVQGVTDYLSQVVLGHIAYVGFDTNDDFLTGEGFTIDYIEYWGRSWSPWEPYDQSSSKPWTFSSSVEEQKTVCMQVKDSNSLIDEECDDIILDYWSAEINLSEGIILEGENTIPRIATWTTAGGVDRIFVVWQNYQTEYWPYYTIWFTASLDGGETWRDPVCVSMDTFFMGEAYVPAIDVGPLPYGNGQYVHVVFAGFNVGQVLPDIYYRRMDTNSFGWTNIYQLTTDPFSDHLPDIAVIDSNVYVAWATARFYSGGMFEGWEIMKVENHNYGIGPWDPEDRVTNSLEDSYYSRIAVDKKSGVYYLHITWEDSRDGGYSIYYALYKDAVYQYELKVNQGPTQPSWACYPTIDAARGKGYFMIVWVEARTSGYQIFYRINIDGEAGGWRLDSALTPPPGTSRSMFNAVSSISISDEAVRVAWEDSREGPWEIFSAKMEDYELETEPWEYYGRVTNHELGGESAEPAVSATDSYLHLVYRETIAGESHIKYKRDVEF
jgi:hypothetical protein